MKSANTRIGHDIVCELMASMLRPYDEGVGSIELFFAPLSAPGRRSSPMAHAFTLCALLLTLVCMPAPAQAYIDPGTGGMMVQLLLGGLAGVVVVARLFWSKVLSFIGLRQERDLASNKGRADGGGDR